MNPGKRGSLERNNSQKGSDGRPSPAMHDRSSGKHSPGSSHSPASKCSSIPLLQNEMSRAAAGFLANFTGAPGFTPPVWQDLPYLINPLAPSFMPPIPLGLDMFSSPFLHPIPGSAPGLFPPGLPLLRPPTGSGILHPPYAALFPNVGDIPVHLLPKPDQPASRPRSAKKTSSLASSSSESDIAGRSGVSNLATKHEHKHDPKGPHSNKQFWHNAAELAKAESRKQSSVSPAVSNSKLDEMVDILGYSDCDRDSPLELTVKKSNKSSVHEVEVKRSCPSTEDVFVHEDVNSRGSCEIQRGLSNEIFQVRPLGDDVADLSLHKTAAESLKINDQSLKHHVVHSDQVVSDVGREESREKADDHQHFRDVSINEAVDLMKTACFSTADLGSMQISGLTQTSRQNIALPPRKRLTRNPEELGLGMPNQLSGSDSPSSTSNFRSCWKKFAAKANHNGQPRAFAGGGKPLYDCRTFFQKMAAKDACKSGILIGKTFIAGKGKGYFHRAVSRTSPRFSRNEGGAGLPSDGSSSPRVTRSQSKLKQKKSAGSPKSSPTESPLPVRKSLRKKTANSKYEADDVVKTTPKSAKKDTPAKGKGSAKNLDKELSKVAKSVDSSETGDDCDLKKSGKPYSLRDREEKSRGRGLKSSSKDGSIKYGDASSFIAGCSVLSDCIMETPEQKRDCAEDWPEEKGSGGSLKNMEQDRKSVSSSCSADMAMEPEMNLSLPPKFRRTKRKTMSTSQSLSSVEDERSSEGVKDVKIDLCRPVIDLDPLSYAGCCKSQSATEVSVKPANATIEIESKGNLGSGEINSEPVVASQVVVPSLIQENKLVQEPSGLDQSAVNMKLDEAKKLDVEKIAEVEKRSILEKRTNLERIVETKLGPEKKSEVDRPSEVKMDRQNRSTGGKKSLLYRSSLKDLFDDGGSTFATVVETNVSSSLNPGTQFALNITTVEESDDAKMPNDTQTIQPNDEPGHAINRSEEIPLTELHPQNTGNDAATSKELIVPRGESTACQDSVEPFIEPEVKPNTVQPFPPDTSIPQTDSSESILKAASKMELADASLKNAVPVTTGTELPVLAANCSESGVYSSGTIGCELSVSDIPVSSVQPTHELASCTNTVVHGRNIVEEQTCGEDTVCSKSSEIIPSRCSIQVIKNDDSLNLPPTVDENKTNLDDVPDITVKKSPDKEQVLATVQSVSKRKPVDDNLVVLNKKMRRDENMEIVVQKATEGMKSDERSDDRDLRSGETESSPIGACTSSKNSSVINPLHFYSKTSLLLHGAAGPSSDVGSCLNSSHSELTQSAEQIRVPASIHGVASSGTPPTSVAAGKSRPVINTDLQAMTNDSEPPVLEKTDFTYTEQFSDISDTDEDETRGPPLLEATNSCTPSSGKPCSSFALGKHILFAKITSSALQDGVASIGLQSSKQIGTDFTPNTPPPISGKHLGEHKQVLSAKSDGCTSATPKNTSDDSSSFHEADVNSRPAGSCIVTDHLSSAGVDHSVNTSIGNKSFDPDASGILPVSTVQQNSNYSKITSEKSACALRENVASKQGAAADDNVAVFDSKVSIIEGHVHKNTTVSSNDLESCGIATASVVKETGYKAETPSSTGKSMSRVVHTAKNESKIDSLLQHCRSVTVVVQKIDDSHKSQHQNDLDLGETKSSASVDCAAGAGREETNLSYVPAREKLLHETKLKKTNSGNRKSDVLCKNASTSSNRIEADIRTVDTPSNKAERSETVLAKTEMPDKVPDKMGVASKKGEPAEAISKREDSVKKVVKSGSSYKKMEKSEGLFNKSGKAKKADVAMLPAEQTIRSTSVLQNKSDKTVIKRTEMSDSVMKGDAMPTPSTETVQHVESGRKLQDNTGEGTENKPMAAVPTSVSCNAKVTGRSSNSRKRKPKVISETAVEEFCDQKRKSVDTKMPKADKKDLCSVYDFEKDSLSTDFDASVSRKEFSKKVSQVEARRPLRLKLSIPEQEKMTTSSAGKSVSASDVVSKAVKDRLRNTEPVVASKHVHDSEDKLIDATLDSNSNSSAVGHVKCRLVKVGRHQWMSVGESNAKDFGTAVEHNRFSSEVSHSDESLLDSKSLKQTGKSSGKVSHDKAGAKSSKQNRTRAKSGQASRQKRGKRGSKIVVCSDISVSDNSLPSQDQSTGVTSPQFSVGQADRCSENESTNISAVDNLPISASSQPVRIPDFLDVLLGDDFTGLGYDELNELRDVGTSCEIRYAVERANFGKIAECELEDYLETLSPASTFFIPSEIEMRMAKMTISDYSSDNIRTCLTSPKTLNLKVTIAQQSNAQDLQTIAKTSGTVAADFVSQSGEENSLELDRLLTETLNGREDNDDDVANQLEEDVTEEFVSWLSPNWDVTSIHDFEDPWSSMNLLSPFVDLQKSLEHLNT